MVNLTIPAIMVIVAVGLTIFWYFGKPKKKDTVIGIAVVLLVLGIWMGGTAVFNEISDAAKSSGGQAKQVATSTTGTGSSNLVSGGCNTAPPVTYGAFDKYNASSPGSVTNNIKVNDGKPVATYTAGGGEKISYLPTLTGKFIAPINDVSIGCNGYSFQAVSIDNSTGGHTYNIFNDLGNVMDAGGGTNNLTLGTGASKSVRVEFASPSEEGIAPFGAAWCVEGSSKTNLDSAVTKFPGTAINPPQRITLANAAGFVNCVEDNTDHSNGAVITKFATIKAASGVNSNEDDLYVHIIPKVWFVDIDGNYKLGYQNSNNVNQALNDYIYNFETE